MAKTDSGADERGSIFPLGLHDEGALRRVHGAEVHVVPVVVVQAPSDRHRRRSGAL